MGKITKKDRAIQYHVGQVVMLTCDYYGKKNPDRYKERYQRITHIEPWDKKNNLGDCLTFSNGDEAHQKWVRPLTTKEIGR